MHKARASRARTQGTCVTCTCTRHVRHVHVHEARASRARARGTCVTCTCAMHKRHVLFCESLCGTCFWKAQAEAQVAREARAGRKSTRGMCFCLAQKAACKTIKHVQHMPLEKHTCALGHVPVISCSNVQKALATPKSTVPLPIAYMCLEQKALLRPMFHWVSMYSTCLGPILTIYKPIRYYAFCINCMAHNFVPIGPIEYI